MESLSVTHFSRRAALLGALLAAVALPSAGPISADTGAQTVHVLLTDTDAEHMTLSIDQSTVKPGTVIFDVINQSKEQVHEMLVIRVDSTDQTLPYDAENDKVIEEDTQDLGEVADLDPGKGGQLTLDLAPGHYLLFCNEPGHYKHGMMAEFTVAD